MRNGRPRRGLSRIGTPSVTGRGAQKTLPDFEPNEIDPVPITVQQRHLPCLVQSRSLFPVKNASTYHLALHCIARVAPDQRLSVL